MGGEYNHSYIVAVHNLEITNYFIAAEGKIFYQEQSLAKMNNELNCHIFCSQHFISNAYLCTSNSDPEIHDE